MTRSRLVALALLCGASLASPLAAAPHTPAPAVAPAAAVALPAPVVRHLDNGLRIMVFPVRRLPIVQVQLLVPAGSADASADVAGVATMTAASLRQGTPSRDAVQLARDTEALGATITAVAGRDYTLVGSSFLAGDLDAGLELISDVLLRPAFPAEGVDRLRRETLGSVIQGLDNPVTDADEELWTLALPGHPYGRPTAGTLETVPSLGGGAIRAFYRDHYRPDRSVLAIAGDVDPDRTVAAVTEWFGSWSGRAVVAPTLAAPAPSGVRVRIVDRPELTHCEIRVGAPGPARGAEDDLPLGLANWVLGGSPASRLAHSAAASAHSSFTALRGCGLLAIGATARVDSAGAVAHAILDELARLTTQPPSEAEIAAARRYFVDVYPLPFETLAGITAQSLAAAFYDLPADFSTHYAEHLSAITPAAVASAVRRWADPAKAVVVAVGPADKLRAQLQGIGTLEVLPAGGTLAGSPPTADEQRRGRERIAQAVEAHGGRAKLEGVHSSRVTSGVMLGIGDNAIRGEIVQIRAEPERLVLLTKVQGQQNRQVLDHGRTWTETDVDTVAAKEGDSLAVARMRATYESDLPHLLLAALRPEAVVSDRGHDRIGEREVDRIEVVIPGGPRRRYLLDAQSHRLLAVDEPGRSGVGYGARRSYDDYRQVDGLWWPHHEEVTVDGERVISYDAKSVILNGDVPATLFQRNDSASKDR